jgi:hypothetical protein
MLSGEEVDARLAHVPALLDWACGGEAHLKRGNYMAVVEGRDWPKYSSCADLAHWLLYRLGCRQEWINRAEHTAGDLGPDGWDNGVNVSRLAFSPPRSVMRSPIPGYMVVEPGDILIVWSLPSTTDAHVMVAASSGRLPGPLRVAEYGQPGGHLADKVTSARDGAVFVNGKLRSKELQRWLPLHLVLTNAAELGQLEPVALPWEGPSE